MIVLPLGHIICLLSLLVIALMSVQCVLACERWFVSGVIILAIPQPYKFNLIIKGCVSLAEDQGLLGCVVVIRDP